MRDIVERLELQAFVADKIQSGMKPLIMDCLNEITNLRIENEKLRDAYDTDALTISYNLGYTCGKDIAKDEIERLRAENEKLREALKPFADAVLKDEYSWKYDINSDDFRAAAAAFRRVKNN